MGKVESTVLVREYVTMASDKDHPNAHPYRLNMVYGDGDEREFVIVDRARFERLLTLAKAVSTKQFGGPDWTGTYEDDSVIDKAIRAIDDANDLDPLP